ncbi:transposase [Desulfallas sp. Bu1-1]|uniref:transposase n=1 Tax=Desulfallas sp. Bu1-1 TaxID=2787620 RepID=UPI00189DC77A|nr:transposase [Desulfallas sp. Bu1-1]MBF7082405.1 transposase [Desulfallas sp. Bu1-1]
MPHLRGFTKTFRYNLLMPASAEEQAACTITQYRQVVYYYLQVFQEHQEIIGHSQWLKMAENLTHRTEDNPNPEYPFDEEFPNFPSGFRRNAIAEAHGKALAWRTSYEKWEERKRKHEERNARRIAAGKKPIEFTERPPQYPEDDNCWLSYYGTEYKWEDSHHIMLKMFTGRFYTYRKVALLQPFVAPPDYAAGSPMLVKKPTGWELHVPVVRVARLNLKKIEKLVKDPSLKICLVDLGMKRHAVMTIQDTNGRVHAAKFISGAKDNHLRKRYLEKIVNLQMQTKTIPEGKHFAKYLWDKISNLNDDIAHRVSREIVNFAKLHRAKIIVFEYLGDLKPSKGSKSHWLNQKFNHWVKGRIFRYTRYKALHEGIITCRVPAKNTSTRCPYCGMLTVQRYNKGRDGKEIKGVDLAKCTNCGVRDINSDFVGGLGIGTAFRLKHCL